MGSRDIERTAVKRRRHPAFGALKGTFTIAHGVDLAAPTTIESAVYLDEKSARVRRRLRQDSKEYPVPLGPRLRELQTAMDLYGSTSAEFFNRVHMLGNAIARGFERFLGEGAEVVGVPPSGDWDPELGDYHDAKFSDYHGVILVEPVDMGLAIKIPHSRDAGSLWVRLVLTFEPRADGVSLWIGDSACGRGLDASRVRELEPVYECILNSAMQIFDGPLVEVGKLQNRSMGFVNFKQMR